MRKIVLIMFGAVIFVFLFSVSSGAFTYVLKSSNPDCSIRIHEEPSVKSGIIGFACDTVNFTGKTERAFLEIEFDGGKKGWVFYEYYVIFPEVEYVEFEKPVEYVINAKHVRGRRNSTVHSSWRETEVDEIINVMGKKGFWLRVEDKTWGNYWIYYEYADELTPETRVDCGVAMVEIAKSGRAGKFKTFEIDMSISFALEDEDVAYYAAFNEIEKRLKSRSLQDAVNQKVLNEAKEIFNEYNYVHLVAIKEIDSGIQNDSGKAERTISVQLTVFVVDSRDKDFVCIEDIWRRFNESINRYAKAYGSSINWGCFYYLQHNVENVDIDPGELPYTRSYCEEAEIVATTE